MFDFSIQKLNLFGNNSIAQNDNSSNLPEINLFDGILQELNCPKNSVPTLLFGSYEYKSDFSDLIQFSTTKNKPKSRYIKDLALERKKQQDLTPKDETKPEQQEEVTQAKQSETPKVSDTPPKVLETSKPFNQEITFDGQKMNITLVEKKLDDGSTVTEGEMTTPKGKLKYTKTSKANGEFSEEIIHEYLDGSVLKEYTKERDNTSILDKSRKRFCGQEYTYTDKTGVQITEGKGKCIDKKTGELEMQGWSLEKNGIVEMHKIFYNSGLYSGSSYQFTYTDGSFRKDIPGETYVDENGAYYFVANPDADSFISPPIESTHKESMRTDDFKYLTGLSSQEDGAQEFPNFEFHKDSINTDPKVVAERGEVITHTDYGTKTEFCKTQTSTDENGQEIQQTVRGYSKTDETGNVIQEWIEVANSDGSIDYIEEKIYDAELNKHLAVRTYYNKPISSVLEQTVSHKYYIQGDNSGTMRYTQVVENASGEFSIDYNNYNDYVQWDNKGATTSVDEIKTVLALKAPS